MSFFNAASSKKKRTWKGKCSRDTSPAYGPPEESSEEKARLIKLSKRLKEVEDENQILKEELKDVNNKYRSSKQELAELKAQQEARKKEDTNKITDGPVSSSPIPKMTLAQSFTELGSDEVRDGITDICSYCASEEKLRPATHFCFDCGVYGRYICGECLQSHNIFVYDHVVETIAMQSKNRRKQLQNDLAAEKRKTESTAKELAGAFQELQIHKEKREKLQTDLLTERLKSESIAKELAGALKELESHKEKRTKETEIQIAKYEVELKRKEAECQEKMNKDVKRKIAENEEETKRKIWRYEEENKRKEAEYQERMQDGMKRLRGQLQIEIEAKENALRRIKESERQISTYEVELKRKEAECQEKIYQCLKSTAADYEDETKRKILRYEEELKRKEVGYQESQKRMQDENERLCSQLQMEIGTKEDAQRRTKELEIQIAKYEAELKRKEAECQEKINTDVKEKIAENEEKTKRKIWRYEEESKRKEAEHQERMRDVTERLRGQLQIEIEAKEDALQRSPEGSSEEIEARLMKLNERLKEVEDENQRLKEELKDEQHKNRVLDQESAELKAQLQKEISTSLLSR